jgi:DNA-binding CsgD family transcriptional regulator
MAQRIRSELSHPVTSVLLDHLQDNQPNLRAAMTWSIEHDPDLALQLGTALAMFWRTHGYLNQGRAALDRALESGTPDRTHRADALFAAAEICEWQRDHAASAQRALAAQALYRELGNPHGVAMTLQLLGHSHVGRGQASIPPDQACFIQAQACFEQELALFKELGSRKGIAWATESLGIAAQNQYHFDQATACFQHAIDLYTQTGDDWGSGWAMANLAAVRMQQDQHPAALALYARALDIFVDLGDRWAMIQTIKNIALVWLRSDLLTPAVRILGAATALRDADGITFSALEQAQHEDGIARAKKAMDAADFDHAWVSGASMALEDAVAEVREVIAIPPDIPLPPGQHPDELTSRERAVLRLLMEGRTDREIAEALSISHRTVNGHVAHVLAKLGAETRTAAAAIAIRNGIV